MSTLDEYNAWHSEAAALAEPHPDDDHLVSRLRGVLRGHLNGLSDYPDLLVEHDRHTFTQMMTAADLSHLNEAQVEVVTDWADRQTEMTPDRLRDFAVSLRFAEPDPFDDDL